MTKHVKIITSIAVVAVIVAFIGNGILIRSEKKADFEKLNAETALYAGTTAQRIAKTLITLPDGNILVGLDTGTYTAIDGKKGQVSLQMGELQTEFILGTFEKALPRLDALVPMSVSADPQGGSTYVVLFWDRGDVAIEKSYARLGSMDIVVEKITTLPPETGSQEYLADIVYQDSKKEQKETIIPVIDGHFDPGGTVEK